jgi:membrane protease YdiL (CAAX protease family)
LTEAVDERLRLNGWFALLAVGMFLAAIVVSAFCAIAGDQLGDAAALVLGATGNYGTLYLTCWWVSRWKGTGDVRRDFGIRGEARDLYRGVVTGIAGHLARIATAIVLVILFTDKVLGSNGDMFDDHKASLAYVACAAVLALVLAPCFEELYFRGLILRSLEGSFAPTVALVGQGLLFGLAHTGSADTAMGNIGLVLSLAAVGVVLGVCTRRYGRLVPNMVGHCCFNLPAIIVLFATR